MDDDEPPLATALFLYLAYITHERLSHASQLLEPPADDAILARLVPLTIICGFLGTIT
jgi:hypothetical protein